MGFHDNNSRTVSAILTNTGRRLLSQGQSEFKITKFAVSDEGVDYSLYNPDHPSGSAYYAEEITNMPLVEAIPNETMIMRHKLVTLPKGTTKMPSIKIQPSAIEFEQIGETSLITPNTTNTVAGFNNNTYGYTCILSNNKLATLEVDTVAPNQKSLGSVPSWMDESTLEKSQVKVGMTFRLIAKPTDALNDDEKTGTITVIGNETGGQDEIQISSTVEVNSRVYYQ